MTKEQKMEAFRLKLEGCSYDLIAMRLGTTRQNVQQCLMNSVTATSRKKYLTKVRTVYPAICEWCTINEITTPDLALLMNMNAQPLRNSLNGKRKWRIREVAQLIDLTGMSLDQLFRQ